METFVVVLVFAIMFGLVILRNTKWLANKLSIAEQGKRLPSPNLELKSTKIVLKIFNLEHVDG